MKCIEIRLRMPGFHCWPTAPSPVEFLSARHRHTFHIRVRIEVEHSDRNVEFILFRKEVEDFVWVRFGRDKDVNAVTFGNLSCEHIAEIISNEMDIRGFEVREVGVSEDGEFEGIFINDPEAA